MKNHRKLMIKPLDVLLIVLMMSLSFVPLGVFFASQLNVPADAPVYAVILINGTEVDRFRLTDDANHLYTYTNAHGLTGNQYNIVEIQGMRIRVQADNSPDQIGVNMGWISRPGQTIVVLPHRFLIRLETSIPDSEEIIIPF